MCKEVYGAESRIGVRRCRHISGVRTMAKRTNIEIDEGLVAEAMEIYGTRTMRETVDLALRTLVGERLSFDDALAMRGTGWDGDLDAIRAGWAATRDVPDGAAE
jgi:Arc/MetJ family transcription regulator